MVATRQASLEQAFGRTLREIREQRGISQEGLADLSDLHRTYISQIERGLKSPSLGAMRRLSAALDLPLHELVRRASEMFEASSKKLRGRTLK